MHKAFDNRLSALEQRAAPADAGRVFVCYLDDERYLIDGQEVERAEWLERSLMAGASSYTIEVLYREMEQPE